MGRRVDELRIGTAHYASDPVLVRACVASCEAQGQDPDEWITAADRPRWATYIVAVRGVISALAVGSPGMVRRLLAALAESGVGDAEATALALAAHAAIEEMMSEAAADLPDIYEPDE